MAVVENRKTGRKSEPFGKPVTESHVLIVGGGPAGCVAGILLAREGIPAVLLEKNPPGYHKICGDLLGPRSLQFLNELRIGWPSMQKEGLTIEGIQVHDEKGLKSVAYLEKEPGRDPVGITLRRDLLNRFLQRKAEDAGCRLLHGMKFREFARQEDRAVLCRASDGREDHFFRAGVVLGADGARSATAKAAGLFETRPEGMILAVRGYYRNIAGLRNTLELYPLSGLQPGYAWVIPLAPDLANVGLGVRADVCSRDGVRLHKELLHFVSHHPILSQRMKNAKPEGALKGWPVPAYGSVQRLSGPHVLLLGDAGGFIDPLSGEGVFGGMQSAWIAVDVVRNALRRGRFTGPFLAGYDERCRRFFDADFGAAAFATGLLAHSSLGKPLAMWGLKKVERNCLLDPGYARMITGFFTGLYPRRRFLKPGWLAKTLFR